MSSKVSQPLDDVTLASMYPSQLSTIEDRQPELSTKAESTGYFLLKAGHYVLVVYTDIQSRDYAVVIATRDELDEFHQLG